MTEIYSLEQTDVLHIVLDSEEDCKHKGRVTGHLYQEKYVKNILKTYVKLLLVHLLYFVKFISLNDNLIAW